MIRLPAHWWISIVPMSEERHSEIKAGVERIRRQSALFAEMATVNPMPDESWNFCLTREHLENLLDSLNAELSDEDGFENGGKD
jgi:hypothetical protein